MLIDWVRAAGWCALGVAGGGLLELSEAAIVCAAVVAIACGGLASLLEARS